MHNQHDIKSNHVFCVTTLPYYQQNKWYRIKRNERVSYVIDQVGDNNSECEERLQDSEGDIWQAVLYPGAWLSEGLAHMYQSSFILISYSHTPYYCLKYSLTSFKLSLPTALSLVLPYPTLLYSHLSSPPLLYFNLFFPADFATRIERTVVDGPTVLTPEWFRCECVRSHSACRWRGSQGMGWHNG